MKRGSFITFEGGEGMGKSTQIRLLAQTLEERGIDVVVTREPGGTPGGEAIRELLLQPPGEGWTIEAEALLFAAARADHVARLIVPALESGRWVLCDRFVDSSRAYQGIAGEMTDDAIKTLHGIGSGGLMPDLTLVLDASDAEVTARLARRDGGVSDAIGGRTAAFHASVNAAFQQIAASDPDRVRLIDGTGSIEEVRARVADSVANLLASRS
ncbi:dTMP kinase [Qipengyuania sp. XHP0207]|uniref:dTMP kinase n=1 Tax=Qipengyuania sp. XHP0207 TaxID=3038078 RepID=UPI00241FFD37|nr:dTMP kinase [Qipengyuania sp. XHP0207]MDG5749330.1 dTMP kinase [Qipengyuania sp. XHP0207]